MLLFAEKWKPFHLKSDREGMLRMELQLAIVCSKYAACLFCFLVLFLIYVFNSHCWELFSKWILLQSGNSKREQFSY